MLEAAGVSFEAVDAPFDEADVKQAFKRRGMGAAELSFARRLFADNGWPVIDVTRRSIEETAYAIVKLCEQRSEAGNQT